MNYLILMSLTAMQSTKSIYCTYKLKLKGQHIIVEYYSLRKNNISGIISVSAGFYNGKIRDHLIEFVTT